MGSAIGEAGLTVLASEEGGGTSNFLIPNGTFFVLAIFLIVLFVIGKFVVPPVQKVLGEREAMIARTTEETRKAAQQEAAADADYRKELGEGRSEAAAIRDEARAEGRAVVDEKRALANDEVAGTRSRPTRNSSFPATPSPTTFGHRLRPCRRRWRAGCWSRRVRHVGDDRTVGGRCQPLLGSSSASG